VWYPEAFQVGNTPIPFLYFAFWIKYLIQGVSPLILKSSAQKPASIKNQYLSNKSSLLNVHSLQPLTLIAKGLISPKVDQKERFEGILRVVNHHECVFYSTSRETNKMQECFAPAVLGLQTKKKFVL
jgi:hypothetical protein